MSIIRKSLVGSGVALGAAGLAAVGAWAASVTVSSSSLGAGATTIAACQTSGTLTSSYTTSDTGNGYQIISVTVSGVDATHCNAKTLSVTVSDGTANNLGTGSAAITTPTSYTITLGNAVQESAATHLDIEIK